MKLSRKIKIFSLLLSAVMLLPILSSCDILASTEEESTIVMTIGDYEVPYEVYYYVSKNIATEGLKGDELIDASIETLKEIYAVFALGEKYCKDSDSTYIAEKADVAAEASIEEYGSEEEYKKALEKNYLNDSTFRFIKKHTMTADTLLARLREHEDFAMDHAAQMEFAKSDEVIRIKQILVTGEGGTASTDDTYFLTQVKHTDEEALAIATEAYEKALLGEDFDELVRTYGESLFMFNNTDGYYLMRGMWEKENEESAFALEIGEISPVTKSSSGYSVFQRLEKSLAFIEANLDEIIDNYYSALYNRLLEDQIKTMKVETNSKFDELVK